MYYISEYNVGVLEKVNVWISCIQRAGCWNYHFRASSTIWGDILESRGKPWASFLSGRKVSLEMWRYKNLKDGGIIAKGKRKVNIFSHFDNI